MQCQKHPPSFQISSNFNSLWWRSNSGTPSTPTMIDVLGLQKRLDCAAFRKGRGDREDSMRNMNFPQCIFRTTSATKFAWLCKLNKKTQPFRIFQAIHMFSSRIAPCNGTTRSRNQCLFLKDTPKIYHSLLPSSWSSEKTHVLNCLADL